MGRGLPFSLATHILVLVAIFYLGNKVVSKPPVTPRRTIQVRMVEAPKVEKPEVAPPEPVVEKVPEVIEPVKPPKEKPKPEKKPEVVPEKKPEPKPEKKTVKPVEDPVQETTDSVAPEPTVSGPSLAGTDVDFPFTWYLQLIEGNIARNWKPKQVGFRENSVVFCVIHFNIATNGSVSGISLKTPSGVNLFDRQAEAAIMLTSFPRLPPGYSASSLGVSMYFTLESGI